MALEVINKSKRLQLPIDINKNHVPALIMCDTTLYCVNYRAF